VPEPSSKVETATPENAPSPPPAHGASYQRDSEKPDEGAREVTQEKFRLNVQPVSSIGFAVAQDGSDEKAGSELTVARRPKWCPPCPPCPAGESEAASKEPSPAPPVKAAPGEAAAANPNEPSSLPSNALAGNYGAASGPMSAAPNMMGDLFGAGGVYVHMFEFSTSNTAQRAPLAGDTVPRFKMADNTSPLPQDRVYLDYSFYGNVPINTPGVNVNSFAPGFEKTFLDGRVSFELRLPMADTLDQNYFFDNTTRTSVGEIGDLGMVFKGLLFRNERFAMSGGLAMTAPTGPDERFYTDQSDTNVDVLMKNESVHLMPFVGFLWTPNDRWFSISYLQLDVDSNGTPISVDNGRGTLSSIGTYREPTFMYLDLSLGYWAYRSESQNRYLTGIAPVVEVHVNQSLEKSPVLINGASQVGGDINGNQINNISIVDLMVGLHVELCGKTTLTAAYCTPATGDRQFDGEFRCFLNRRF
jgi:hypothetical protein